MKKNITISILATILMLAGCAATTTENAKTDETKTETVTPYIFSRPEFALNLPADFNYDGQSVLSSVIEKDFPTIIFGVTEASADTTQETLLKTEQDNLKNLCSETSGCGEIINSENVTVGGIKGIKFTVQYKGRSMSDPTNGYINEYHYNLYNTTNNFYFYTSATDQETPEKVSTDLDTIINTISF